MVSFLRRHLTLFAVSACSIAVGIGISSITSAGAASASKASRASKAAHVRKASRLGGGRSGMRELGRLAGRAVEGDLVVSTANGFETVSFERGVVGSVSGEQLTMSEQTKTATYKTVTLTIPAGALIRDDGSKVSSLASLTQGQRVIVFTGVKRTLVVARMAKG